MRKMIGDLISFIVGRPRGDGLSTEKLYWMAGGLAAILYARGYEWATIAFIREIVEWAMGSMEALAMIYVTAGAFWGRHRRGG